MTTPELEKIAPEVRRAAYLARGDILVHTENGRPAFAIVGAKDEMALEALALRRARTGERYLLKEIRQEFGIGKATPPPKRRKRT